MNIAIIPASGSGQRLIKELNVKKQYYKLDGKHEMFLCALYPFLKNSSFSHIVLVIPCEDKKMVSEILTREGLDDKVEICFGEKTRQQTVAAALKYIETSYIKDIDENTRVFIHDGDRPLLSPSLLNRLVDASKTHGAVIPSLDVFESIYNRTNKCYEDRKNYVLIQTPQVFSFSLLTSSFKQVSSADASYGDEGSLVQHCGHDLFFVEGEYSNIKITDEQTLNTAKNWMRIIKHE